MEEPRLSRRQMGNAPPPGETDSLPTASGKRVAFHVLSARLGRCERHPPPVGRDSRMRIVEPRLHQRSRLRIAGRASDQPDITLCGRARACVDHETSIRRPALWKQRLGGAAKQVSTRAGRVQPLHVEVWRREFR